MGEFARNQRYDHQLAVLGRSKRSLVLIEIGRERLRRRLRDFAGLCAVEQDVFDRPLLVPVTIRCLHRCLGHDWRSDDRVANLTAQHFAPLLRDESAFGKSCLPKNEFEALPVELPVGALESRVRSDSPAYLAVRCGKSELPGPLVDHKIRHDLADDPAVEACRARLVEGNVLADLPAKLLEAVPIEILELIDRNFGAADLGEGRSAEPAENIVDAPDREADNQEPHDDGQDNAPKPICGCLPYP